MQSYLELWTTVLRPNHAYFGYYNFDKSYTYIKNNFQDYHSR
jgi:hypothetical protein